MAIPIFSSDELSLLQNSNFFYVKAEADAKINALFTNLMAEIESTLRQRSAQTPEAWMRDSGRQYRGENLHLLPWRALDCPRSFAGDDIFCFRTLLIWGKSFSFHFLLKGRWLHQYSPTIIDHCELLAREGWAMSLQKTPWDWTDAPGDFLSLALPQAQASLQQHCRAQAWLKLSIQHPIASVDQIVSRGNALFASLLDILQ